MISTPESNGSDPLDAVVADYLQKAESGTPPDRDALVAAHPDLADRLRAFFADLDRMGSRGESFRLPDLALPEDFGDYEFLGEIGRGGMGVVYRVRQRSSGRVVALKMILSGALADASALRRFRDEAETVSRLDHPHVVPVYEVGEHRGLPYFTMKLIEGQSLTKCLDWYAGDPKTFSALLAKVCDAVHHAHQRGVLHRDLKPGNILIDNAGEPHVTDFGLARRVEEARSLTTTGAVLGTPEYMAPEQAAGGSDPTVAVDVYGLGAVLYALLTGRPPFTGPTAYDTLRRVVEDSPVPPRRVGPRVPADLEAVCLKCLEKNPARRYATAEDVGAELLRYLSRKPVLARTPGRIGRLARWARRKPTVAALYAATCAGVTLAGVAAVVAWQWRETENARKRAEVANAEKDDALVVAGQQKESADREREKVAILEYGGVIRLAHQAWRDGDHAGAVKLLDGTRPDLRGWEWHYVRRLCNPAPAALPGWRLPQGRASVPWSPDGTKFVAVSGAAVAVFDANGRELVRLDGEHGLALNYQYSVVAFSPDGSRLLTHSGAAGGLWDAATGKQLANLAGASVEWSQDGALVLGTVTRKIDQKDNSPVSVSARRWDARTGRELVTRLPPFTARPGGLWKTPLVWHPKGTRAAGVRSLRLFGWKWSHVSVFDLETGDVVLSFPCQPDSGVAGWTRDGGGLVTAVDRYWLGDAGSVGYELWDAATGARLTAGSTHTRRELYTHGFDTPHGTLSEDGKRLLLAPGSVLRFAAWNLRTGEAEPVPQSIVWLAHAPRGGLVLAAFRDGTVRVLEAKTWKEFAVLKDFAPRTRVPDDWGVPGRARALLDGNRGMWSADGTLMAAPVGKSMAVWDARSGEQIAVRDHLQQYSQAPSWSPAGARLLVRSPKGALGVWEVKNGGVTELKTDQGGDEWPTWSPDGKRLIAGSSAKNQVSVWDTHTGEVLATFPIRGVTLSHLPDAWSPDGRWLVTAAPPPNNGNNGTPECVVRDATTLKEVHKFPASRAYWSPDGKMLLCAPGDPAPKQYNLFTAGTWEPVATLKGHYLSRAVWSPDGSRVLITAGLDVWVWDARTGTALAGLAVPFGELVDAVWSPDGKHILTTSSEIVDARPVSVTFAYKNGVQSSTLSSGRSTVRLVRVWDAQSGDLLRTFAGPGSLPFIGEAPLSPDGNRVLAVGFDYAASVYDTHTGRRIAELTGHRGTINRAGMSADGARVVTASNDHTARVWDAETGAQISVLAGHAGAVRGAFLSRDGRRAVTTSEDRTLRVWDADTGQQLAQLWWVTAGGERARPLPALSADGAKVLAQTETGLEVWDARSPQVGLRAPGHAGSLGTTVETYPAFGGNNRFVFRGASVAWSPSGARIVTAGADGTVRMWEPTSGRELALLWSNAGHVTGLTFSRDGSRLVATSSQGTARIWDGRSGRLLGTLEGHRGAATGAAFSPDGSKVVTTSVDGTSLVWWTPHGDVIRRPPLAILEQYAGAQVVNEVTSVSWSPDGTRLVTGSRGGGARIWDTRTWKTVLTLPTPATDVSWSPRGDRILVRTRTNTSNDQYEAYLSVWDAHTGAWVGNAPAPPNGSPCAADWSPDGKYALIAPGTYMPNPYLLDADAGKEQIDLVWDDWVMSYGGLRLGNGDGVTVLDITKVIDGKIVADASEGFPDRQTAKRELFRRGAQSFVNHRYAAFSPDGTRALTAIEGGCWVWDVRKRKPLASLWTGGGLTGVAWSPDAKRVVTGHEDGTARVWDASSGKVLVVLSRSPASRASGAVWSPNGTWLLTSETPTEQGFEPPVTPGPSAVWDARTGALVCDFPAGAKDRRWPDGTPISTEAKPVTVSPDGTRKVEVGPGNTIRILHAATGAELLVLRGEADGLAGPPRFASWSPDGHRILIAAGRAVTIFDATPLGR